MIAILTAGNFPKLCLGEMSVFFFGIWDCEKISCWFWHQIELLICQLFQNLFKNSHPRRCFGILIHHLNS